jgi:hypothetical protein
MMQEGGAELGKGVFLDTVIENIEKFDSNYYQKATLEIIVSDVGQLYPILKENNIL